MIILIILPIRFNILVIKCFFQIRNFYNLVLWRDWLYMSNMVLKYLTLDNKISKKNKRPFFSFKKSRYTQYYRWQNQLRKANNLYLTDGHNVAAKAYISSYELLQKKLTPKISEDCMFFGAGYLSNIGHMPNLAIYPKLEKLGWTNPTSKTLFYCTSANDALAQKFNKYFSINKIDAVSQSCVDLIFKTKFTPMEVVDTKKFGVLDSYTAQHIIEKETSLRFGPTNHLFDLSPIDLEKGFSNMQKFGLDPNKWFATFHMREATNSGKFRGGDNVNPATYAEGMMRVIELGGQVVRIGNSQMTTLEQLGVKHPNILDFAIKNEFDDAQNLFWLAACRFLVGTGSGPVLIPNEFGKPILYTNVPAIGRTRRLRGISLPQLIKDTKRNKILSVSQMLDIPLGWNVNENYKDFTRIRNSNQEIKLGINEIYTLTENADHNYWLEPNLSLQNRYFGNTNYLWEVGVPVSQKFLEKNEVLIDG